MISTASYQPQDDGGDVDKYNWTTLTLLVTDGDDQPPEFSHDWYEIWVEEEASVPRTLKEDIKSVLLTQILTQVSRD